MAATQAIPPLSTAPTSSLTTPPSSGNVLPGAENETSQRYRSTKELPFELAQHVQTYFEETLFTQGFDFLTSLISNTISPSSRSTPMLIPGPPHLALAATIVVHPNFTTRTTLHEKWNQANSALRLLRLILQTAGPINANFIEAFRFNKYATRPLSRGVYESEEEDEYNSTLKTRYASTDSLFTLADDFWSIVGWAFNCSCLPLPQAPRWTHYELLLTFLLDLLEADWHLHFTTNTTEESLTWNFIELATGGFGRARRVMRAIFADGSTRSLNEFREIFRNELKPPKDEDGKFTRRMTKVDIDKDEFGDYLGPDDSDISDDDNYTLSTNTRPTKRARTRTPSRRTTPRTSNESLRSAYEDDTSSTGISSETTMLGSPNSLRLRIRLLHLLSNVSAHPTLLSTSPTTFPDLDDLYTLFVEFVKPLPLPIYTQIIAPSTYPDVLGMDASSTLAEILLQRMLESAAPVEREESFLTLGKLVRCYAGWAAGGRGSVGDQARVAVAVEALIRRCKGVGMLDAFDGEGGEDGDKVGVTRREFINAVEAGIERREGKGREWLDRKREGRRGWGKGRGRGKAGDDEDEEAWRCLRASGERVRMVLKQLA